MFGSLFSTLSPSFAERKEKKIQVNRKSDFYAEGRCPREVSFPVS